jgi:hypothetical protein
MDTRCKLSPAMSRFPGIFAITMAVILNNHLHVGLGHMGHTAAVAAVAAVALC